MNSSNMSSTIYILIRDCVLQRIESHEDEDMFLNLIEWFEFFGDAYDCRGAQIL